MINNLRFKIFTFNTNIDIISRENDIRYDIYSNLLSDSAACTHTNRKLVNDQLNVKHFSLRYKTGPDYLDLLQLQDCTKYRPTATTLSPILITLNNPVSCGCWSWSWTEIQFTTDVWLICPHWAHAARLDNKAETSAISHTLDAGGCNVWWRRLWLDFEFLQEDLAAKSLWSL